MKYLLILLVSLSAKAQLTVREDADKDLKKAKTALEEVQKKAMKSINASGVPDYVKESKLKAIQEADETFLKYNNKDCISKQMEDSYEGSAYFVGVKYCETDSINERVEMIKKRFGLEK